MDEKIEMIIETIKEIQEDTSVPKNVKKKLDDAIAVLNEDADMSIKKDKALHILDELSEDTTMQAYIRTQIWNIVSALETI
jgi:uncharacterized protein (UPF0147 family)